ncbi:hypothetical protein L209DRAFT_128133 [Thermothelomyces heterothallicus CBS 203.75]
MYLWQESISAIRYPLRATIPALGSAGYQRNERERKRARWESGKEGCGKTAKLPSFPGWRKRMARGWWKPREASCMRDILCHFHTISCILISTHLPETTHSPRSRPRDGCAKIGGLGRGGRKRGDCPSRFHKPGRLGRPRRPERRGGGRKGGWDSRRCQVSWSLQLFGGGWRSSREVSSTAPSHLAVSRSPL